MQFLIKLRIKYTVLFSIICCGCTNTQLIYKNPAGLSLRTGAILKGSDDVERNPLLADTRVFPVSIDNQPTGLSWSGWNTALRVEPGHHLVTFGPCQCGSFDPQGPFGSVTFDVNFMAGETYILRSTLPHSSGFFQPIFSDAWIEDGSGASITSKIKVELTASKTFTPIPIFIPTK